MNFLQRVSAKIDKPLYVSLEDIYNADSQYQQYLKFTTDLLYKFAKKFHITDEKMLDVIIKSLKKEIL